MTLEMHRNPIYIIHRDESGLANISKKEDVDTLHQTLKRIVDPKVPSLTRKSLSQIIILAMRIFNRVLRLVHMTSSKSSQTLHNL